MTGNDVVDLELASRQSNWRRKGFFQKVFSKNEQELITTSKDPDNIVWLLWSMKEAAYKAHQREYNLQRKLNWQAQKCSISKMTLEAAIGIVEINGNYYYTTSEITSEYIHTSAENCLKSGIKNVVFESSPSAAKENFLREVSEHFRLPVNKLQLEKDHPGIPFLSINNTFFFNSFSFSGHGRFYAYSLSLINCETSVKQS